MKNDNKSDDTIKFNKKALSLMSRHSSLAEPESFEVFISQMQGIREYLRNEKKDWIPRIGIAP